MKDLKHKAEILTDHVTEYIETYTAYSVLKATDKAATIASGSITSILIGVMTFFILLFGGIGVGYYLGEQLNNMLAGFGIVAGFFTLIVILLLALNKSVLTPYLRNRIIKSVYE
jgi:hypothetical protein